MISMRTALLIGLLCLPAWFSHAQTCTHNPQSAIPTPPAAATPPTPPATGTDPKADPCHAENCPAAGTVCADGTIYVGLSSDGNRRMFAARCNHGLSWNGSSCTGTLQFPQWDSATGCSVSYWVTNSTSGYTNTENLMATSNAANFNAVRACYLTTVHGRTDWYLPATNELALMYTNRVAIQASGGAFYGGPMWTSTEVNICTARSIDMTNGTQSAGGKTGTVPIRCVRREAFP